MLRRQRFYLKFDIRSAFSLCGYMFYSVYACMLFHSPTAISPVASFGSEAAFWFTAALLVGRMVGYVACSMCPARWWIGNGIGRPVLFVGAVLALVGFVILGMDLQFAAWAAPGLVAFWLCIGAFVVGLADAAVALCVLGLLAGFGLREVCRCLLLSNLGAVFLYYVLTLLPPFFAYPSTVTSFFLAIGACAVGGTIARDGAGGDAHNGASARRPSVASLWRPVFGVSALAFMAGLMLQISRRDEVLLTEFQQSSVAVSVVMYATLYLALHFVSRQTNLVKLYQAAIPISAMGFLLLPLIQNSVGGIVNSFANLGYMLALLVLTCLAIEVARKEGVLPGRLIGVVYSIAYGAHLVGIVVGFFGAPLFDGNALAITTIAITAVYILSLVSLTLFKDRSFRLGKSGEGGDDSILAEESGAIGSRSAGGREAICKTIALSYDLTEREYEIFSQLSQGNTVSAVAKRLVISESTVKYHTKTIYKKLGIHTRQELLDLVHGRVMGGSASSGET